MKKKMGRQEHHNWPLRKIVGKDRWMDVLECGHTVPEASDIIGRVYTRKQRRCWKCAEAEKNASN